MKSFRTKLSLALALALSLSAPSFADDTQRTAGETLDDATITAAVKAQLLIDSRTEGFDINVDTLNGVVTLRGGADTSADKDAATAVATSVGGVAKVENLIIVAPDGSDARTAANSATMSGEVRAGVKGAAEATEEAAEQVAASTERAAETAAAATERAADKTAAATERAAENVAAATENAAEEVAQESREAAAEVDHAADKAAANVAVAANKAEAATEEAAEDTGDAWLTTKVKTKLLAAPDVQGTAINVETRDGVVHLIGKMPNATMKTRAIDLARTTEGVKSVDAGALTCCQ